MANTKLFIDHRHDHYWIEDEQLFESYQTLRGLRYRHLMEVKGMPDCDNCPEEMIAEIQEKYLSDTTESSIQHPVSNS